MHRSHALAALLAAAALLGGCKQAPAPTAAPATKAPATPAATSHLSRTARLEAFVRMRYGDKASLSADWAGEADGFKANSQVCAEQPVVVGEQVQQLLAVCHSLSDGGHGNPGLVDFFVLRGEGDGFKVVAEKLSDTFGSDGQPGSVDILRLGSDFYGFIVHSFWMGQGLLLESQDLVVPGPKGLANAGSLRAISTTAAPSAAKTPRASRTRPRRNAAPKPSTSTSPWTWTAATSGRAPGRCRSTNTAPIAALRWTPRIRSHSTPRPGPTPSPTPCSAKIAGSAPFPRTSEQPS